MQSVQIRENLLMKTAESYLTQTPMSRNFLAKTLIVIMSRAHNVSKWTCAGFRIAMKLSFHR